MISRSSHVVTGGVRWCCVFLCLIAQVCRSGPEVMSALRQVQKLLSVHETSFLQSLRSLRKKLGLLQNSTVKHSSTGEVGSATAQHRSLSFTACQCRSTGCRNCSSRSQSQPVLLLNRWLTAGSSGVCLSRDMRSTSCAALALSGRGRRPESAWSPGAGAEQSPPAGVRLLHTHTLTLPVIYTHTPL